MHEVAPVHEAAVVHEPAPASDVLVDEVHGSENKVPFFLSICLIFYFTCLCILPLCDPL